MTPCRIQRRRTKGWRMPANTCYVGRPSAFGNPYRVERRGKAWIVMKGSAPITRCLWRRVAQFWARLWFRLWLDKPAQAALRERIRRELRGRNVCCWCRLDEPCHGDILLEMANA